MVYSTEEYGYIYGSLKAAESQVLAWISDQSPQRQDGKPHTYTRHGKLAADLGNQRIYLPPNLMGNLKTALDGRVKLARHHMEHGDADDSHGFPIEMLKSVAASLCPPNAVQELLQFLQTVHLEYRPSNQHQVQMGTAYHLGTQGEVVSPYPVPQLWYDSYGVAYPVDPMYNNTYYQSCVGQQQYQPYEGYWQPPTTLEYPPGFYF